MEKYNDWENEKLAKVKIKVLRGHNGGVNTCCFLNGENLVVSGGEDKTVRIWDSIDPLHKLTLTGHNDEITCCRSSPDGRKIASTSLDKYLMVWDSTTGQPLLKSQHDGMVMSCDVSFDGKYILSCSDLNNAVLIWDVRQKKCIKTLNYHTSTVLSCRFARGSHRFCSTSMDLTTYVCHLWDYCDQLDPHFLLKLKGHINMIASCDFSADERRLCTGSWDKTVNIWDVNAGTYRKEGPLTLKDGHDGCVSACRFFKDGSSMISASYDETLVVWDVENACKKFSLESHTGWVTDCDLSDDEKSVISSSKDGTLRFWDIENSDEIPVILQNKKNIGLRLLQCQGCTKQFSIAQAQDALSIKYCVFCRLERQSAL
ncbi:WD repeat-containing protein 88-like [Hydractinia symbiolongicarpus]|uniref:WD repeat-containing protein 88-like n=1 Tax=Hydractinia symbiolongicarpus TaxID=13093 RepID=UPI00254C3E88|nr:WD repeat-containing protein 88-like [Hydractinia symbiolongicarpus]